LSSATFVALFIAALVVWFTLRVVDVLLLVFLATLGAVYVSAIADLLDRRFRVPRWAGLTIAVVGTLALLGGSQVVYEADAVSGEKRPLPHSFRFKYAAVENLGKFLGESSLRLMRIIESNERTAQRRSPSSLRSSGSTRPAGNSQRPPSVSRSGTGQNSRGRKAIGGRRACRRRCAARIERALDRTLDEKTEPAADRRPWWLELDPQQARGSRLAQKCRLGIWRRYACVAGPLVA